MTAFLRIRIFGPLVVSVTHAAARSNAVHSRRTAVIVCGVPIAQGVDWRAVVTTFILISSETLLATVIAGMLAIGMVGILGMAP